MSKYFNFCVFVTTLGIVSMTHAMVGSRMFQNIESELKPYTFDQMSTLYPSGNALFGKMNSDTSQGLLTVRQQSPQLDLKTIFSKQNSFNPSLSNAGDSIGPSLLKTSNIYSPSSSLNTMNSESPQTGMTSPFARRGSSNVLSNNQYNFYVPRERQNSFIIEQNDTNHSNKMTKSQNNPSVSEGEKMVSENGKNHIAFTPEELTVKYHGFVRPEGLRESSVDYIRTQILERANFYRTIYECDPLTLRNYMNNDAQQYANNMARRNQLNERTEDKDGTYGQTIGESSPVDYIGKNVVDTWYNELRFLKKGDSEDDLYHNPDPIGNMTQLLWKKSKFMGIGVAKNANNKYFIVAEYYPKGNIYPFYIDNLPTFEQQDIEAAKIAHKATENTTKTLDFINGELTEPVPNSNSVNDGTNQYTNSSPIRQSNWKLNLTPASKQLSSSNMGKYTNDSPIEDRSNWRPNFTSPSKQLPSSNVGKYTYESPIENRSNWRPNFTPPSKQLPSSNVGKYTYESPIENRSDLRQNPTPLSKQIPSSNVEKYTYDSPNRQSDWRPNTTPMSKKIPTEYGLNYTVNMPPEHYPILYEDFVPLRLTRDEVEVIRIDVLKKSNHYRDMYKMPRLVINEQIDHYAQEWANYLAKNNQFKHRPKTGVNENRLYGENIYKSSKVKYLGELAVDMWYAEIGFIGINDNDETLFTNSKIGHMTQLLWRQSRQMGVGAAVNGNDFVIVVANYNPGGNIKNFYLENLPKFTQEQIYNGKMLEESINEALKIPVRVGLDGQLPAMPGWQSVFYENTPVSSALQNVPTPPGGKKMFLYDGLQTMATMPEDTPVQYRDYVSPTGLDDSEVDTIRLQVLARANFYRQRHDCDPLDLNTDMNNHAQEWANYLALQNKLIQRTKDKNGIYGQTLFASSPCNNLGEKTVDTWYSELRFLKEGDGENDLFKNPKNIGNIIQLLWKRSKKMGVGVAKNANDHYFIVAEYNPKGNIYPFLLDYLPKFKQQDIEAAKSAHEATEKTIK